MQRITLRIIVVIYQRIYPAPTATFYTNGYLRLCKHLQKRRVMEDCTPKDVNRLLFQGFVMDFTKNFDKLSRVLVSYFVYYLV